jgi:hypothetical protein
MILKKILILFAVFGALTLINMILSAIILSRMDAKPLEEDDVDEL